MIHSLFIINQTGDVIIEKHYRGFQTRAVCDIFWREVSKATSKTDLSPIIKTPKHYLVHICCKDMYFLATVLQDSPPLLVIEFLYRVVDVFSDYFQDLSERAIKENFVTVYQILEEMMDNGFPFTTEPNALKEMISPTSLFGDLSSTVTGKSSYVSSSLSEGRLSSTPWRKAVVKYSKDEIFFDIVEEIDCIIDSNGLIVTSEVAGNVASLCRLSDMPDLTMIFNYPRIMTDVSFHPCVRLTRWEQNHVVSFIPPDGQYKLMQYRVNTQVQPPIYCKPQITYHDGQGKISVMVGPKNTGGKVVEDVKITFPFPKSVLTCNLEPSKGKVAYDENTKTAVWTIGTLPADATPTLNGTVNLTPGLKVPDSAMTVLVDFTVNMFACSGLKVESLNLQNVGYKPFKGVRSITKAGKFQVRTGK